MIASARSKDRRETTADRRGDLEAERGAAIAHLCAEKLGQISRQQPEHQAVAKAYGDGDRCADDERILGVEKPEQRKANRIVKIAPAK
jgi:hypothetical protein